MISADITVKSQFYDLDPMGIVWHGNYARFFEQARCALLDKLDFNYEQMNDSGFAWPIVDMRIKYIRPIRFAQEVKVTATLVEYENRLKIQYQITDATTEERLTRGFTIQVAIDKNSEEMLFQSPSILYRKVEALLC
ncbi:acyl-CoA thioesterase [Sneathiella litorea]|uniref:YbgC/FadM family acyl-CoA thioesterase n=1 Tax=Sneathiella litorea TaxID=2606216 RepID=A0A6L8WAL4_9PROT|nr:acyl-CoA thioesterase [Sneathiella litorea]MZR32216.1 YbgC/FadM family acyl-CoA thioesterase [Sneathiella litorea]